MYDHTDTNGVGFCDWLAGNVSTFNDVANVGEEIFHSVVGVSVCLHPVLIEFLVVFVGFAVVSKESLKHVAEAHIGITNTGGF